jgi:hypothetical protein
MIGTAKLSVALAAYQAAGRALDAGMRRPEGATVSEWAADDSARLDLLLAQCDYIADINLFNKDATAFLAALRRSMHPLKVSRA